jgi:hypothetical protein
MQTTGPAGFQIVESLQCPRQVELLEQEWGALSSADCVPGTCQTLLL